MNWREVHQRYRPQVAAAKDDKDFYSILDRMTAELHDAHTRFSSPEQWRNHEKHQGVSLGFRPGYVEGKVAVLDVIPESNAAHAGIEPGMIVTALMASRLRTALPKVQSMSCHLPPSASPSSAFLAMHLLVPLETPFAASFQRADGSVLDVKFGRQILSNAPHVTVAKLSLGFWICPL